MCVCVDRVQGCGFTAGYINIYICTFPSLCEEKDSWTEAERRDVPCCVSPDGCIQASGELSWTLCTVTTRTELSINLYYTVNIIFTV